MSRQRFAQAAATLARAAVSRCSPRRARRERGARSRRAGRPPSSSGRSRTGRGRPSTIARPCSVGGRPFSSTTQATVVPPTSRVRAATCAAAVRRRSASSARLPRPTAPIRSAATRPSACRRVDPALVSPELARLDQPGQPALDQPVETLRGAGELNGVANGEGEDVGLDPPGRRLDDINLHEPGGMLSERRGGVPRSRDEPVPPGTRYREGARAQLHPLPPARTLPSAGEYLSPRSPPPRRASS